MKIKHQTYWLTFGLIVALLATYFALTLKNVVNFKVGPAKTVAQIQVISQEAEVGSKNAIKHAKYYSVTSNGKVNKTRKFTVEQQIIEVDTKIFSSKTKKTTTYLTLNKKFPSYKMKDVNGHTVTDPNYRQLIKAVAKNVHYNPWRLHLFKAGAKSYYAYFQINEWISDAGMLYHYNPDSGKLTKLCELETGQAAGVRDAK